MNPKPRKWWIAGLLSFLLPGLGQIYNSEVRKGLFFWVIGILIPSLNLILLVKGWSVQSLKLVDILYHGFVAIEAGIRSRRIDISSVDPGILRKGYMTYFGMYACWILLFVITYTFLFQAFQNPSGGMQDTIQIGDHLLVNKFIYGIRVPFTTTRVLKRRDVRRGEIVVFQVPLNAILDPEQRKRHVRKDFIKRLAGLPGDTIEIKNKRLFVNGLPQTEPYAVYKDRYTYPAARLKLTAEQYQQYWQSGGFSELKREQIGDNFGPVKVPENCYFVLGDNRDGTFDSRFWGPLPNHLIKGKAILIYYPPSRYRHLQTAISPPADKARDH